MDGQGDGERNEGVWGSWYTLKTGLFTFCIEEINDEVREREEGESEREVGKRERGEERQVEGIWRLDDVIREKREKDGERERARMREKDIQMMRER